MNGKLILQGPRVKAVFKSDKNRFENLLQSDSVQIEIAMGAGALTENSVLKTLSVVFINEGDDLEMMVPPEQRQAMRTWQQEQIEQVGLASK